MWPEQKSRNPQKCCPDGQCEGPFGCAQKVGSNFIKHPEQYVDGACFKIVGVIFDYVRNQPEYVRILYFHYLRGINIEDSAIVLRMDQEDAEDALNKFFRRFPVYLRALNFYKVPTNPPKKLKGLVTELIQKLAEDNILSWKYSEDKLTIKVFREVVDHFGSNFNLLKKVS